MCNQLPGKRRNNGVALIGVSVLLVAGPACQRGTPAADASRATMAQEPRPVYVAAAVEGRLPRTVIVTGTLAADEEGNAGFKVGARGWDFLRKARRRAWTPRRPRRFGKRGRCSRRRA